MLPIWGEPDLFFRRVTVVTIRDCTWDPAGLPMLLSTANVPWELCHFTAIGRLSLLRVMGISVRALSFGRVPVSIREGKEKPGKGACYSGVDIGKSSTTYRQAPYHSHDSSKKSIQSTGGIICLKKANKPCPETACVYMGTSAYTNSSVWPPGLRLASVVFEHMFISTTTRKLSAGSCCGSLGFAYWSRNNLFPRKSLSWYSKREQPERFVIWAANLKIAQLCRKSKVNCQMGQLQAFALPRPACFALCSFYMESSGCDIIRQRPFRCVPTRSPRACLFRYIMLIKKT